MSAFLKKNVHILRLRRRRSKTIPVFKSGEYEGNEYCILGIIFPRFLRASEVREFSINMHKYVASLRINHALKSKKKTLKRIQSKRLIFARSEQSEQSSYSP